MTGMEPLARIRLQYVNSFNDRHGRLRHYFRRPGHKSIALPGLPGSTEFMTAYQAALAGETAPRVQLGEGRSMPGTVSALIVDYFNSMAFRNLAPETKRTRRNILERFRERYGTFRVAHLRPVHIEKMVGEKAATPSAARNFLNTLRAILQFAVDIGNLPDNPAVRVKRVKVRTEGYRTWSEDDISAFEATHQIGTRARLALALLLYTGQRRSDVVQMGRQHLRDGVLYRRQQKTGTPLEIPVLPELKAVLDATPSDQLTFLTTSSGRPFTPAGFTNWFRECCNQAGLPKGISAHGLRKATCRRLAEAGCSENVIAAISGHKSLKEVQRYTAAANQQKLARHGMEAMRKGFPETTKRTSIHKPE
jgi:integrase